MVWIRYFGLVIMVLVAISTVALLIAYDGLRGTTRLLNSFIPTPTDRRRDIHTSRRLPSLLCLVLASPEDTPKMEAVNKTWARRCDKTLFVYGSNTKSHLNGDKLYVNAPEGKPHLTAKVKAAFQFAFKTLNTFDWYLKADTDTYMIVENLKLLLSYRDPRQSVFLGCHLKPHVEQGYMSGGAGYVLSSSALRDIVVHGIESGKCNQVTTNEDVEIGRCLQVVHATIWSSLDKHNKETFHMDPLEKHMFARIPWSNKWMWTPSKYGSDCCGKFSISFHHLTPENIYMYEHLLYKTEVYNNQTLEEDEFKNTTEMPIKTVRGDD